MTKNNLLSLELPGKYRIPSVDYFRTVAIFLVIFMHNMHTNPLQGAFRRYTDGSGGTFLEAIIEIVLGQIFLLAVPFFFIIAGYFYGQKVLSCDSPARILETYLKRLVIAFLFWQIVYFFIPNLNILSQPYGYFRWVYNSMTDLHELSELLNIQTTTHLWFVPALVISLCTVTFFHSMKKEGIILPFVILLCVFYLLKNTYATTPWGAQANSFFLLSFPSWMNILIEGTIIYYYPLLFVSIGWYLATRKIELGLRISVVFILSGVVISCFEVILLWKQFGIIASCLIGTVPLVIGLAMFAFSMPNIGRNSFVSRWGRYAFGIYLIHYAFVIWLRPLADLFEYPFSEVIHIAIVYFLSLVVVVVCSKNKWLRQVVV